MGKNRNFQTGEGTGGSGSAKLGLLFKKECVFKAYLATVHCCGGGEVVYTAEVC